MNDEQSLPWSELEDYIVVPDPMDPTTRANADAWWKSVMKRKQSNPELIIVPSRIHEIDLVGHAFLDISEFLNSLDHIEQRLDSISETQDEEG